MRAALVGLILVSGSSAWALGNPAAEYCIALGYSYNIRTTDAGQEGICIFPDSSECDEWAFFNGQCGAPFTYCEKHGGQIASGSGAACGDAQAFDTTCALCTLPDGGVCPEYDLYRGACGSSTPPDAASDASARDAASRSDAFASDRAAVDAAPNDAASGGCSCSLSHAAPTAYAPLLALAVLFFVRARRPRVR